MFVALFALAAGTRAQPLFTEDGEAVSDARPHLVFDPARERLGHGNAPIDVAAIELDRDVDIQGDGVLDVLLAHDASDHLDVLENRPEPGYLNLVPTGESLDPSPSGEVVAVVTGDLEGDGYAEVVVVTRAPDELTLYLGGSGGLPGAGARFSLADTPIGVVVGNFDGDGPRDVAVVGVNNSVTVIDGNTGSVTGPLDLLLGSDVGLTTAKAIIAADLDFNGQDDLLIGAHHEPGGVPRVHVLYGESLSPGAFEFQDSYLELPENPSAGYVAAVQAADLDADGKVDVAVAVAPWKHGPGLLWGFENDTTWDSLGFRVPLFRLRTEHTLGPEPAGIAAVDWTGDGLPELAVLDAGECQKQQVDPTCDPAVTSCETDWACLGRVAVFDNEGAFHIVFDGDWPLRAQPVLGRPPRALVAANVNSDPEVDLLVADPGRGALIVLRKQPPPCATYLTMPIHGGNQMFYGLQKDLTCPRYFGQSET